MVAHIPRVVGGGRLCLHCSRSVCILTWLRWGQERSSSG